MVASLAAAVLFAATLPRLALAQDLEPPTAAQRKAKAEEEARQRRKSQGKPKPGKVQDQDTPQTREAIIEQTSRGEAVSETAAPGWPYPKAIGSRPLTLNKYMIRATFSVGVKRAFVRQGETTLSSRALVSIDIGGAFSPLENLEVGITNYRLGSSGPVTGQSMFPIVVSPIGTFGDMPIYVRYSFLRKEYVEMGADFVIHIPTWTNLAATLGFPVRIRVRDTITIDTGTELTVLANGAGLNVEAPFKFTYNPSPAGFIFADSGFSFQNLARNVLNNSYYDSNLAFPAARNQVFIPLAVGGGYTHVVKDIVMLDIFARLGWNPFIYINPPSGTDISVVPAKEAWVLSVGVLVHTSPILHSD
jgi:hypothetical protein